MLQIPLCESPTVGKQQKDRIIVIRLIPMNHCCSFSAELSGNSRTAFAIPRQDAVRRISRGRTLWFSLKSLTPTWPFLAFLSADELFTALPLAPSVQIVWFPRVKISVHTDMAGVPWLVILSTASSTALKLQHGLGCSARLFRWYKRPVCFPVYFRETILSVALSRERRMFIGKTRGEIGSCLVPS